MIDRLMQVWRFREDKTHVVLSRPRENYRTRRGNNVVGSWEHDVLCLETGEQDILFEYSDHVWETFKGYARLA